MATGLRTPLYDWHVAHGARMVDFAGWDMPVIYSSIVEEHQTVRTAAGIFDISHMARLSFAGADVLAFLQSVCTNNIATMKDFQVRYSLLCNEAGGVRDDVLVYRWPYGYAMVVNASNRTKVLEWFDRLRENRDVQVMDQTTATCMVAVQGPQALAWCRGLTEVDAEQLPYYFAAATRYQGNQCVISRTGYTGEDGLEIMLGAEHGRQLWEDLIARGAKPCGLGARDTLRLEAAMPLYGHELSETIDPLQAGLPWAVKLDKGDFVGRDALQARAQDQNRRRRVGLVLAGRRIAREGSNVLREGQPIGTVTSGTFAPTVERSLAMAYVDPACAALGTSLAVDVRGHSEPATVVKLPFYQRAK